MYLLCLLAAHAQDSGSTDRTPATNSATTDTADMKVAAVTDKIDGQIEQVGDQIEVARQILRDLGYESGLPSQAVTEEIAKLPTFPSVPPHLLLPLPPPPGITRVPAHLLLPPPPRATLIAPAPAPVAPTTE